MPIKLLPQRLTRREIWQRATKEMLEYVDIVGPAYIKKWGIHFDHVYEELIYPKYEIVLKEDEFLDKDELGEKCHGLYLPHANVAYVDASLRHDRRRTFTVWQEVAGHGMLQGDWLRQQIMVGDSVTTNEIDLSTDVEGTLEWQANKFASHMAAPLGLVRYFLDRTFGKRRCFIGPSDYEFRTPYRNRKRFIEELRDYHIQLALCIKHYFVGLSADALSYQVADSKWVIDMTAKPTRSNDFYLKRRATSDSFVPRK